MALDLDDGLWPLWVPPQDVSGPIEDRYGHISCFVVADKWDLAGAMGGGGLRQSVADPTADRRTQDFAVLQAIYARVVELKISYATGTWLTQRGQRVRDPHWIVSVGSAASCLDLTLLAAGLCLQEEIDVSIALLRGYPGTRNHALLAVHLGAAPGKSARPRGCYPVDSGQTVLEVGELDSLAHDERCVLVDMTRATGARPEDLGGACCAADTLQMYERVHLIHVERCRRAGDMALSEPAVRGALDADFPAPAEHPINFSAHGRILDAVQSLRGLVVLHGPTGTGKSTLALRAASRFHRNKGWLIPATSAESVNQALAEYELRESNLEVTAPDREDSANLAKRAVERLADGRELWTVVIDNADSGPEHVKALLDRPADRQLAIVTTTMDGRDWIQRAYPTLKLTDDEPHAHDQLEILSGVIDGRDVHLIAVKPIPRETLETEVADPEIRDVMAGIPLLLAAFSALKRNYPNILAGATPVLSSEDSAALYWKLLSSIAETTQLMLAAASAWLPPDNVPIAELARLFDASDQAAKQLVDLGYLTRRGTMLALHRLMARAARTSVTGKTGARTLIMPILSSQPLVDHLLRLGDTEVMKALLDGLGDADPEIAGLGASISRVAWLEEFHGGVKKSAGTYERASAALSEDVDTDRPWLAEGLHARARVINQQPNPTVEQLAAARALLRKAIQLRDDDTVGVATHEALDALLQRAESQFLPWQSDERINMLHEVERTLMASYAVRAEHGDERLADRAYFNLAGTYIQLAQQEPARALEHLAAAEEVYERTLRFRRGRYSAPSAIAASCISGLATVAFYRAVLRPDFLTTPLDAGVSELLDTATSYELDALRERQSIAGVDPDTGDAAKSYRMLAKIFTARFWRPSGGSGRASFVRELARELQHGPNSEV